MLDVRVAAMDVLDIRPDCSGEGTFCCTNQSLRVLNSGARLAKNAEKTMINVPYVSAMTNPLLHASRLFGAELSTQTNPTVEPPKSLLMRAPVQSSHAIRLVVMKEVVKALGYSKPWRQPGGACGDRSTEIVKRLLQHLTTRRRNSTDEAATDIMDVS